LIGDIEKMSKSKPHRGPRDIFETYGVDAARLFRVSDSPPDANSHRSTSGVEGCGS